MPKQSRIEPEKERLLQGFHRLYKGYSQNQENPFDISNLMYEQYVTEQQAELWNEIEGKADLTELEKVLQLAVERYPELKEVRSVLDNGCGSGRKSVLAYLFFNPEGNYEKGNLHLLDISGDILKNAGEYALQERIPRENLLLHDPVNFHNLGKIPKILEDRHYILHLFLGQTLGNFRDPVEILRKIMGNAKKMEYLLLEWLCREPEVYNHEDYERLYRLLFAQLGYLQEAFGNYHPYSDEEKKWNIMPFTVQDVPEEKRTSGLLDEMFGKSHALLPGTKIVVSRSRRFKEEEVIELGKKAGLEAVVLETWTKKELVPPLGTDIYPYPAKPYLAEVKKEQRWSGHGVHRYALFRYDGTERSRAKDIMLGAVGASFIALLGGLLFLPMRESNESVKPAPSSLREYTQWRINGDTLEADEYLANPALERDSIGYYRNVAERKVLRLPCRDIVEVNGNIYSKEGNTSNVPLMIISSDGSTHHHVPPSLKKDLIGCINRNK